LLGRRSLAGKLYLTCARYKDHFVCKCPLWVSQPGQLSLPSLRGQ